MIPTSTGRTRYRPGRIIAAAALVLCCLSPARAQQDGLTPPKVEVKATFGAAGFGDEVSIPHVVAGGSLRFYVTRRLSVEPELLYMRHSPNDQDYVFTPGVAYDLRDPTKRVVPYVVGGVGVMNHTGRFFGADFETGQPRVFDTSFTTWSAGVGAGVKIFLTDRLFVAPEARAGHEPTARGTVSIGYVISGRRRE
jgi:hypothetical protein